jgi:DNA-binding NtrC family response regulator
VAVAAPAAAPLDGVARTIASDTPAADKDLLVTVERDHIQRALVRAGGNKKAAAKMLGLSRRALYRRLERLDLSDTITRRRDAVLMAEA